MELTRDSMLGGALVLWQPARGHGYRFNLDPVLLSSFVREGHHVLDLGAGCGVLGLMLLAKHKASCLTAVERNDEMARLVQRNAEANEFQDITAIVTGDLRELSLNQVDRVVFNPPYFRMGEGRYSPDSSRNEGRFEEHGSLEDFVRVGLAALSASGLLYVISRIERERELVGLVQRSGAAVSRLRRVRSRLDQPDKHFMAEVQKAGSVSEVVVEEPLVVHEGEGREFSVEVRELLGS